MVKWFKQLVTNGRLMNDETIMMYLEIICSESLGIYYVNSFFFDRQRNVGWAMAKKCLYIATGRAQKVINQPSMDDLGIIIPLHIALCHWVVVVRRKNEEGVSFYYADALNCEKTIDMVGKYMTNKKSDYNFCPKNSK